jgi:hypothetical protein
MLEIEGNNKVGSQYVTYQSDYSEVTEFLSSGRQVFGTNMLGFHQDIGKEEVLAVYFDFLHRGVLLQIIDDNYEYEGVITHKYSLKDISGRTDISTCEQTERTLSIVIYFLFRILNHMFSLNQPQEAPFRLMLNTLPLPSHPSSNYTTEVKKIQKYLSSTWK